MLTTVLVAPAGRRAGLTTACLGIVRALDREGLRVAFVKPIANRGRNHSAILMSLGAHMAPTPSVLRERAEELLAAGDDQTLMEHVVEVAGHAAAGADVLIAEGLDPEAGMLYSSRVNALMLRALDAELVLVASPCNQGPAEVAGTVAIAARGFGALVEGRSVSCILNRVCGGAASPHQVDSESLGPVAGECGGCAGAGEIDALEREHRAALEAEHIRPLGIVPCNTDLAAPRVHDVAVAIGARQLAGGDTRARRVRDVAVCAMSVQNALKAMRPGTLLITPGDRNDILLAAAMAVQDGTPLAGIVLTGGLEPDPYALGLCRKVLDAGLPLLTVNEGTFRATTHVASMNTEIQADDAERVERTMNFVADRIDTAWAKGFAHATRVPRLSPPAFRHRLVEAARTDLQRIVLPEGNEPRTVAAAAIIETRGIAHCVLLGNPDEIHDVAAKQGSRCRRRPRSSTRPPWRRATSSHWSSAANRRA